MLVKVVFGGFIFQIRRGRSQLPATAASTLPVLLDQQVLRYFNTAIKSRSLWCTQPGLLRSPTAGRAF